MSRRNQNAAASNLAEEAPRNQREHPLPELSDELVEAARRGDRDAQRKLYDYHHDMVYRLTLRMTGIEEASDLTQQVFLQAFRSLDQFSGRAKFSTWLYRLAVNEALQFLRRAKRAVSHSLTHEPMDDSFDPHNLERKDLLERALEKLEPDLRSIFLLREVEELPYGEIASVLDIPEGTVGSRLNRARRELRQHLIQLGWEP